MDNRLEREQKKLDRINRIGKMSVKIELVVFAVAIISAFFPNSFLFKFFKAIVGAIFGIIAGFFILIGLVGALFGAIFKGGGDIFKR